jgi:hypothetical protein
LTFLKSLSIADVPLLPNSPPAALLTGVFPPVLLTSSARAAGVSSLPSLFGVAFGGSISPLALVFGVPESMAAFSRMERPAFALNLRLVISRFDGSLIRKGLASMSIVGSSPFRTEDRRRGVDNKVPIVINSFIAAGPRVEGDGDGIVGT